MSSNDNIPKHMTGVFRVSKSFNDKTSIIEGTFQCPCSSRVYKIFSHGAIKRSILGNQFLIPLSNDEQSGINISAVCSACGSEIAIFDSRINGYNAEIAKQGNTPNLNTDDCIQIPCSKCQVNAYNICVKLEYTGLNEICDDKSIDKGNAFSWIWVSLVCTACGKKFRNFVNFETG